MSTFLKFLLAPKASVLWFYFLFCTKLCRSLLCAMIYVMCVVCKTLCVKNFHNIGYEKRGTEKERERESDGEKKKT